MMKTIQMTIDEGLLDRIDRAVLELGTNRSAFIRNAVENALRQLRIHQLEAQHVAGYERQPLPAGEIEEWDAIRAWGDA
ncbi:MAG: CopG family transcriptional regulator [Chloroflexi bacterium]|nr:MAG: CopG family transcriptional regulator [Chloroflexota bacterium]